MTSNRRTRHLRPIAIAAAAVFTITACGGDDDSGPVTLPPAEGSEADGGSGESGTIDLDTVVQETGAIEFEVGTQLPPYPDSGDDPAIGSPAPVVEGERFDGSSITIGDPTEGPELYVFLAHWCPHCNDEIPKLIELEETGRLPSDLRIVAVATGTRSDAENYPPSEWLVDREWPFDSMVDDENLTAIQVYGGSGFPFAVVVDEEGTVQGRRSGTSSTDEIANWVNGSLSS